MKQTALSSIPFLLPLTKTESQCCSSTLQRDLFHSGSSNGDRWQLVCSELDEKPIRDNANSNLGPRKKARKKTQRMQTYQRQEHRASRYEGSHQFFASIFFVADNDVSLGPVSGLSTSLEFLYIRSHISVLEMKAAVLVSNGGDFCVVGEACAVSLALWVSEGDTKLAKQWLVWMIESVGEKNTQEGKFSRWKSIVARNARVRCRGFGNSRKRNRLLHTLHMQFCDANKPSDFIGAALK